MELATTGRLRYGATRNKGTHTRTGSVVEPIVDRNGVRVRGEGGEGGEKGEHRQFFKAPEAPAARIRA